MHRRGCQRRFPLTHALVFLSISFPVRKSATREIISCSEALKCSFLRAPGFMLCGWVKCALDVAFPRQSVFIWYSVISLQQRGPWTSSLHRFRNCSCCFQYKRSFLRRKKSARRLFCSFCLFFKDMQPIKPAAVSKILTSCRHQSNAQVLSAHSCALDREIK